MMYSTIILQEPHIILQDDENGAIHISSCATGAGSEGAKSAIIIEAMDGALDFVDP